VARSCAARGDVVCVNFAENEAAAAELVDDLEAGGVRAIAHRADVGDEAQVCGLFDAVDRELGPLDVLVNNAGIATQYGPLAEIDATALRRMLDVNVVGALICAREAVRRMSTARGGRGGSIVNISSRAAVIGGSGEWVGYAASKGAIDTMTIGLAREVANEGIRVNAVSPGLIESDFHLHATPGRLERLAPVIPMLRAGTAAEVAAAVLWLASDEASYVTGSILDVSGGR
jgi:NAD(P)-dependent dehydrogenase (short-subunit alcohol dehydrogenase family)